MTSSLSQLVPIECLPGVDTDNTPLATNHFTWAEHIRFVRGMPEKIGGWLLFDFNNNEEIVGVARSIYSTTLIGRVRTVIGTNARLYDLLGSSLTNITPLVTSSNAIPNSLDTHYDTLANDPITVFDGINIVDVADAEAGNYRVGDFYTISGATGVGGIPSGDLNSQQLLLEIGSGVVRFRVPTTATSDAVGGGNAVVRSSGLITVNAAAHGMNDGDRVKIDDAATFGGIADTDINLEFVIRNITINSFDIMTDGTANASASSGGGASTVYYEQLPIGEVDESFGQGYGMGLYGDGLYGVSKFSTNVKTYPRIWFFDRFGDRITMAPGNQGGLYYWDGNTAIAPTLIPNAPAAINYQFVSNNILVTFGAGGIENKIFSSDQGDPTIWTGSSTNQVFEDNVEGASRLISHVAVNGVNLIFTETQTYIFSYIGLPLIWNIELKEPNIGIIAPMARVSVNGAAYWMDDGNFYMWSGGNIDVIPSNSGTQSTIHNWMYDDLNYSQKSKTFAWYNPRFNEVWFHSLSNNENEPDKIARLNIIDYTWVPDYISRTAAEYPNISLFNPRLMNIGDMYKHEFGDNDNESPLYFELQSNLRSLGRETASVNGIVPDSLQTGNILLNITSKRFPQSQPNIFFKDYVITPDSERIPYQSRGEVWKYTWSGNELNQQWRMGKWQEYVQGAGRNP